MVGGSNCTTCSSQYYNPDLSQTVAPSLEYTARAMGYGNAKFAGYMIEDDVCLSNYQDGSVCAADFPFFVVTSQIGMIDGIDGILGLGPSNAANGPSYVEYLSN